VTQSAKSTFLAHCTIHRNGGLKHPTKIREILKGFCFGIVLQVVVVGWLAHKSCLNKATMLSGHQIIYGGFTELKRDGYRKQTQLAGRQEGNCRNH